MSSTPTPKIAIIGAGITGLTLASGLESRGIPYTVYERARTRSAIGSGGAGIGLSPNAERALGLLSRSAAAAYEKVANPNGEDYFQWVDGLSREVYYKLYVGEGLFRGCRRADLLEEILGCLPEDKIVFGKALREVRDRGDDGEGEEGVRLVFEDGTEEVADAVIGCDGIRSRLRTLLFGPGSAATYSKKYSFRALIPMSQAAATLPQHMITTRYMYNGPGAHIITYPIANSTILNALVVVSDPNPKWTPPDSSRNPHVGVATADEAAAAFGAWHPDIKAVVALLPRGEKMDKWAIFDMVENPVPRYHGGGGGGGRGSSETSGGGVGGGAGKVTCLAGDAAHACGPHLGAGAGFGIEDAYLLAELLQAVRDDGAEPAGAAGGGKPAVGARLAAAFEVYSDVRYDRTQWLVKHTRDAVDLFQWEDRELSRSSDGFGREITWRFHKIWHYDVEKMVEEARQKLDEAR